MRWPAGWGEETMIKRRDFLRKGLATGGLSLLGPGSMAAQDNMLQYLCPPDGTPPDLLSRPSPPSRPFAAPLKVLPIKTPVPQLDPPPDPAAHQLYDQHPPQKFYMICEQEFRTVYHPDPPYDAGSWGWGFDGITPGPTYHARYGEPILVRRFNTLPPVGQSKVTFALPSTTSHLHNGHTASESDGNPQDWIDPGEFWDHHYGCFPSSSSKPSLDKLTTLWYHDHRMDFTAANVYAGLAGFFLLFDDQDSGNESDPSPAFGLPSGKYDVPLLLHDVLFDQNGQVVFDPFNTDGILGDKYTVNRIIQPFCQVERRKYRFRILNGGPSRFYELYLKHNDKDEPFTVITGDGNFLPWPVEANALYLAVAQRSDVIIDFSKCKAGEHVYLQNRLKQTNGRGPTDRKFDPPPEDSVMRFDVIEATGPDPSRIPDKFRGLPLFDLQKVRARRFFSFDYNGGLWTVNGRIFDPNRVDAKIEQGSAEIWTLRNQGKNWSHPIHSHFTEYLLLEANGIPVEASTVESGAEGPLGEPGKEGERRTYLDLSKAGTREVDVFRGGYRRDMATLLPNDELVVYMEWHDFLGKHVMHCHNVVHEDHAMMIRWDIVKPGEGDSQSTEPSIDEEAVPHLEERPPSPSPISDQEKIKHVVAFPSREKSEQQPAVPKGKSDQQNP
jgi:FtsP/CotA-like multicopper oxidase with cupredoxin domain